jgi:anti-sigma B factor antagonist
VDLSTAPKLRERIIDLIEDGKSKIVLNLADVPFMDSTGLGVMVGSLKRVKERGGTLALAAVTRPVLRVLALTGMDKVFPIGGSVDELTASA